MLKQCGLSLVELVVGLVILSTLFFLCLPLGLSIFQKNQMEVVKDELTAAVHYARTRALLQEQPLVLTPMPGESDWSSGMVLFADNKKHQFSPKTELIQQWQWKQRGIHIAWQGLQSNQYLRFAGNLKHSALSGHFIIQNEQGKTIKLILNRLGRTRVENVGRAPGPT